MYYYSVVQSVAMLNSKIGSVVGRTHAQLQAFGFIILMMLDYNHSENMLSNEVL